MTLDARKRVLWGTLLWLALIAPPLHGFLQANMTSHMLVQMPLLAVSGWWLSASLPERFARCVQSFDALGISSGLLASFYALLWMFPIALDLALDNPFMAIAKFVGIPVFIGAPLRLGWPRMSFIVRGVFLMELIAMLVRLGWLYLAAPTRLCSNYLINDQQVLGRASLLAGLALFLFLAGKLIGGHTEVD